MGCCSCTGAAVHAQAGGAEALLVWAVKPRAVPTKEQLEPAQWLQPCSRLLGSVSCRCCPRLRPPWLGWALGPCQPGQLSAADAAAGVAGTALPSASSASGRRPDSRAWRCRAVPSHRHPRTPELAPSYCSGHRSGFVLCPPQPLASAGAPRRREDVLRQRACAAPASVANLGAVEVRAAAACRAGSRHRGTVLGGSLDPARPALPAAVAPAPLCGIRLRFRGCGAQRCLATRSPGVQLRPLKPSRRRGWARSAQPTPGSAAAGPDLLPLPLSWIRLLRNRSLCHQLCLLFPFKCCHSSISWPF